MKKNIEIGVVWLLAAMLAFILMFADMHGYQHAVRGTIEFAIGLAAMAIGIVQMVPIEER